MSAILMSSAAQQQVPSSAAEKEAHVPKCLRLSVSIVDNPVQDLGSLFKQYVKSNPELFPVKKEKKAVVASNPPLAPAAATTTASLEPSPAPTSPSKGKRVKQVSKKAMRIQPTLVSQNVSSGDVVDLVDDGIEGDSTLGGDEDEAANEKRDDNYRQKRAGVVEMIEQRYQRLLAGNIQEEDVEMIDVSDPEDPNVEQDEAAAAGEGGSDSARKKRKKKKSSRADYYDLDDDFVDDSEIIDMLQNQHEDEHTELAHSGFFVNSGSIDVLHGPTAQKKEKKGKKAASGYGNGNVDPALLASLEALQDPGKAVVVQDWKTDPECMAAFEELVTACAPVFEISDKKARNTAEKLLEIPLRKADRIVLKRCGNKRPATFVDELKTHLPYKGLKKLLNKLKYRESANAMRKARDEKFTVLSEHAKRLVESYEAKGAARGAVWAQAEGAGEGVEWASMCTEYFKKHEAAKDDMEKELEMYLKRVAKSAGKEAKLLGALYDRKSVAPPEHVLKCIYRKDWLVWDDGGKVALHAYVDAFAGYVDEQNEYFSNLSAKEFAEEAGDEWLSWVKEKRVALTKILQLLPADASSLKDLSETNRQGERLLSARARDKERKREMEIKAKKRLIQRQMSIGAQPSPKQKKNKVPRAPSAYNLFTKAIRPHIVSTAPDGTTSTEIMKLTGAKWTSLTEEEKRPYQEEAQKRKEEMEANNPSPTKKQKTGKSTPKKGAKSPSSSTASSTSGDESSTDEDTDKKNAPKRIPKTAFNDDEVDTSNLKTNDKFLNTKATCLDKM
jgi:hypothetical protein